MPTTATAEEIAAGLRQLADMIEANPDIPVSYLGEPNNINVWFAYTADKLADVARAAVRAGATVEKKAAHSGGMDLHVKFGAITAAALGSSNACERVVVGTREITEMVPDPAAPMPPMIEQTRTEEIVEWRCPDSILAGGA